MSAGPRVIVALDYARAEDAGALVARLRPEDCRLKVGLELFVAAGPEYVADLAGRGFEVFLDLKFHDIPNTVAQACAAAARLGVWMVNVHALGGPAMLAAARAALGDGRRPLLTAVTLLTSHDAAELARIGLPPDPAGGVKRLAALAHAAGLDGVVCSAHEAARLRARFGPEFRLVTPGIRPSGAVRHDQARTMTPAAALTAGADYLVIGRPVTQAPDPVAALAAIRREIGG